MYSIPITDTSAFLVEDEQTEGWRFYYVDFDPLSVDSFETPYGGVVVSATINPQSQAVWMIARGRLFAASRELRVAVPLPLPVEGAVAFDVTLIGDRYYVAFDAETIWYYERNTEEWVPVIRPGPRPEMPARDAGETARDYTARTSPAMYAYARKHPDFYKSFAVGGDHYFAGALGHVVRLRGDNLVESWIDSGARLVHGFAEEGAAVLCGDDPVAEIYRGSVDSGFELIFRDDAKALHLTALHRGVRYIGAAQDPDYAGPALFTYDGEDLTPVMTQCAREPGNLANLVSTGSVLWAIDASGLFRLTSDGWHLTEFDDLASRGEQG